MTAVLLTITQGNIWGWASATTIGCVALGVVVLVGWWYWERSRTHPLVSTRMLTRRAMLLTNLATVLVGMGLYFGFLGLTQFVQMPRDITGYGFSAQRAARQRRVPAAGRARRVRHRDGQWARSSTGSAPDRSW